jgi:hypothetical protein
MFKTSSPDYVEIVTAEELESEAQYFALVLAEDLWADIDTEAPF